MIKNEHHTRIQWTASDLPNGTESDYKNAAIGKKTSQVSTKNGRWEEAEGKSAWIIQERRKKEFWRTDTPRCIIHRKSWPEGIAKWWRYTPPPLAHALATFFTINIGQEKHSKFSGEQWKFRKKMNGNFDGLIKVQSSENVINREKEKRTKKVCVHYGFARCERIFTTPAFSMDLHSILGPIMQEQLTWRTNSRPIIPWLFGRVERKCAFQSNSN